MSGFMVQGVIRTTAIVSEGNSYFFPMVYGSYFLLLPYGIHRPPISRSLDRDIMGCSWTFLYPVDPRNL